MRALALLAALAAALQPAGAHRLQLGAAPARLRRQRAAAQGRRLEERPRVFVGIKSAPRATYRQRRDRFRSQCAHAYQTAGISWAFFVGVPIDQRHDLTHHWQGTLDTKHERDEEEQLLDESKQHQDMQFLMFRDQYQDLPDKLLGLLHFGYYQTQADYVMEHDDDFCADPSVVLAVIGQHESRRSGHELWAGYGLWKGTESKLMIGARGTTAPYFSGNGCFVSRGLLKLVVDDDYAHSVMTGFYGTNADDADLGQWVKYAQDTHGVRVDFVVRRSMVRPLE